MLRNCLEHDIDPIVRPHARLFKEQARQILADCDLRDLMRPGDPLEQKLARLESAAEQIAVAIRWKLVQPRKGLKLWLLRWRHRR